jgi:hypothetical protein
MSWIDWWDDKKICRGARQAICDLAQERCNALPEDKATLESLKRGYSEWPPNLFAVFWGNDVFTCNVFVGDALFLDNKNQQNGGKYYSAEEIYDHQGRFTLINKEHVYRGDIAAWGDHVEIVTAVDRSNDTFCSRGGYADRSEETAGVGKEVCGGSKRRISVPTLRYLRVS